MNEQHFRVENLRDLAAVQALSLLLPGAMLKTSIHAKTIEG